MKNYSNSIQTLIPSLIKRVRLERKISQEDLANLANLDRTYISGIERGVRNITLKSLSTLLNALELNIEQFSIELINENKLNMDTKVKDSRNSDS